MGCVVSIEEVRHLYNDFSYQFFGGALPSVSKIMFIFDSAPLEGDTDMEYAGYTYVNYAIGYSSPFVGKYPEQYKYVIALNDKLLGNSKSQIMATLAHEMIHIYQMEQDFDKYAAPNTWHMQHNKLFLHKMKFINSIAPEFGYDMRVDTTYSENDDQK